MYLRSLDELQRVEMTTVSSEQLAELAGVNAAKVRKDLSYVGSYGTRGVGYDVDYLRFQIRNVLGQNEDCSVIIAGAGNLGSALANYGGFGERGFPVAAIVDVEESKIGSTVGGVPVRHIDELAEIVQALGPTIGIVATPTAVAQEITDRLVEAGVASILNFAPALVSVPATMPLRKVDLAIELQILSFYQQDTALAQTPE